MEEYKGYNIPKCSLKELDSIRFNHDSMMCNATGTWCPSGECENCLGRNRELIDEYIERQTKTKSPSDIMEEAFAKVDQDHLEMMDEFDQIYHKPKTIKKESKMNGRIFQVIAVENPAPIDVEERGEVSKIVFGPVTILAANESTAITQATLKHVKELSTVKTERLEVKAIPLG